MYEALTFKSVAENLITQFRPLGIFAAGLALVYFLYGLATFMSDSGNEEKIADAKTRMIWGIVALFVMISMWGLATVIKNSFQLDNSTPTVDYVNP